MHTNRRRFLGVAAAGLAAPSLAWTQGGIASASRRFKAILFDAFPIIDPRPVAARAETLFPGSGPALMAAWRTRQFEYTWLRTLTGSYVDFGRVTADALAFAARSLGLELEVAKKEALLHTFLELRAWPDAAPALRTLRDSGLRLAFLSNLTDAMLEAAVRSAGLASVFEPHLSTDRVRAFKPDPRAYRMGLEAFGLKREQILFAASAGWDSAGARQFGYPTFWVNRTAQPAEELGVLPDGTGPDLASLVAFALRS
jgi:2-haloacid dehalogenase